MHVLKITHSDQTSKQLKPSNYADLVKAVGRLAPGKTLVVKCIYSDQPLRFKELIKEHFPENEKYYSVMSRKIRGVKHAYIKYK